MLVFTLVRSEKQSHNSAVHVCWWLDIEQKKNKKNMTSPKPTLSIECKELVAVAPGTSTCDTHVLYRRLQHFASTPYTQPSGHLIHDKLVWNACSSVKMEIMTCLFTALLLQIAKAFTNSLYEIASLVNRVVSYYTKKCVDSVHGEFEVLCYCEANSEGHVSHPMFHSSQVLKT